MTRGARVARALFALVAFLAIGAAAGPGMAAAACPSPWQAGTTQTGTAVCVYGKNTVTNAAATGSVTVPAGVTSVSITMVGGRGGGGGGGCGGLVEGVLPIPSGGELLSIIAGADGASHFKGPGVGGGGGGGDGGFSYFPPSADGSGSGGGGGSFLFGPQGLIIAAGGGGGADGGGSAGGSAAGTQAFPCPSSGAGQGGGGGQSGTQSAGGQGGVGDNTGGDGAGPATSTGSVGTGGTGAAGSDLGGGGGGGGYYGGGGGGGAVSNASDIAGGGGAGSNYVSPKLSSSSILQNNSTFVGGSVKLSYTSTPPLVVNSTGAQDDDATNLGNGICDINSGSPQVCTLRAAIQVANKVGGGSINFDIQASLNGVANTFEKSDASVPQIQDPGGSGMPTVTAATTIDGTSQPGAGRVELSGTSGYNSLHGSPPPTTGLVLSAPGSVVKGLVINGYSDGIDLKGGSGMVQGDWLGTDAAGTAAAPNPLGTNTQWQQLVGQIGVYIESGDNVVGQSVFATHWVVDPAGYETRPAAAIYDAVGGNTLQGNSVGVVAGTQNPLIDPKPPASLAVPSWEGLFVGAGADTIGGASAAAGNVIAVASHVDGSSVVQGNTFLGELHTDGDVQVGGPTVTPGTGRGNVFTETAWAVSTRLLEISGGVVQGNRFSDTGAPAIIAEGGVTIGGSVPDLGNEVDRVATDPPGPDGLPGLDGAITLAFSGNRVENNLISDSGGYGAVQVDSGQGNTITANMMSGNPQGIVFGSSYAVNGQYPPTDANGAPNDYQPYPVLRRSQATSGGVHVAGIYAEPGFLHAPHSVTLDLYAMKSCSGAPQGEVFLGSRTLSVAQITGFSLTFNSLPAGGYLGVTATATAPNGSTSEFSPCFVIGSHPVPFLKLGVTPSSKTVAISTTPTATADAVAAAKSKPGRGTLLLFCPTSAVKYCQGTFILRTTGKHTTTIAGGRLKIVPGFVKPIGLTITGTLLTKLKHAHRLKVRLATTARDGASHRNHKTRTTTLTLVYN